MNDLMHLKVGAPVVVCDANRKPRPTTVERVGRKYLYVRGDRSAFDRTTGQINDARGNTYLYTPERHAEREAVARARRELWNFGIRVENNIKDAVVLEIREALATIVPRVQDSANPKADR